MTRAKKKKKPAEKHCTNCDNCIYIGEGDYWCDETGEIVMEDHMPNENYDCCKGK